MDRKAETDEERRNAITAWWERKSIREFIAAKRADLAQKAKP